MMQNYGNDSFVFSYLLIIYDPRQSRNRGPPSGVHQRFVTVTRRVFDVPLKIASL